MVCSELLHEVFQTDDKLYIFVYNGDIVHTLFTNSDHYLHCNFLSTANG